MLLGYGLVINYSSSPGVRPVLRDCTWQEQVVGRHFDDSTFEVKVEGYPGVMEHRSLK